MPIYEYQCPACGHRFDALQKFSDEPIRVCPKCANEEVKKLVSATSFVLKGGGWYKDHYGLKSGAAADSSGGSSGSGSSSGEGASASGGGESSGGDSAGAAKSSESTSAPAAAASPAPSPSAPATPK